MINMSVSLIGYLNMNKSCGLNYMLFELLFGHYLTVKSWNFRGYEVKQ